jgi:hypothetical protein
MNQPLLSAKTDALEDPRSRHGFEEQHFPTANGKPAPPVDAMEPNDRIILEFLAAYYELNRAYRKLRDARQVGDTAERTATELEALRETEKILIRRDALEDHYAPAGVLTQPVVKDGFTVDIKFSFGNKDSRGRPRSDLYRLTAEVPIPLPPGAKLEDFIVHFEGPTPFIPLSD